MKKTIFISSTFTDLQQHRKSVWELLEKYEVHVLGMERFGAQTAAPIETCLDAVERADIYIGIIAHRRGSVHPETGKSFTQMEYEKAVELGKEVLIYLINENDSLVEIKNIDFGEDRNELLQFKRTLQEKHTVDFFHAPVDLSQKLENRLDDLLYKKEEENKSDDYGYSKEILEKFHLLPKMYNDREIKLKLTIVGNAFPASKLFCKTFGLVFGETLGVKIQIVEPAIKDNQVSYLFFTDESVDLYFSFKALESVEILGRLVFSGTRIPNLAATFLDKKYSVRKQNPDYDPNKPSFDHLSTSTFSIFENRKYLHVTEVEEGEGTPVLIFRKTFTN